MTDDPQLVDDLRLPVAAVVRTQRSPGLNGAISDGLAYAGESWPDFGVAVLQGDLPALTAEDLAGETFMARLARLSARATEPGTTGPADASASARTTSPEA